MRILKLAYLNITFYFFTVTFLLTCLPALGGLIIFFAILLPKRQVMKRLRRAISWFGAVVIRVFPWPLVRISYKDLSRKNSSGPYIFVFNHRSASDPFLLGLLPYEIIQVVNIWPFKLPVLGLVAKIAGYLSVKEMSFEEFSEKTTKFLKDGVSVAVFPEGTRSRNKSVGQFYSAIFRVALLTRTPVVPLCITGNELMPPIGSPCLHPGIIKIHRLEAITWQEYKDFTAFKLKNYVRDIIIKETAIMDQADV
jgi:1-acyl-sn-glycerol-3-phosphate acyltransferase